MAFLTLWFSALFLQFTFAVLHKTKQTMLKLGFSVPVITCIQ